MAGIRDGEVSPHDLPKIPGLEQGPIVTSETGSEGL
jgi:hypothetical protein